MADLRLQGFVLQIRHVDQETPQSRPRYRTCERPYKREYNDRYSTYDTAVADSGRARNAAMEPLVTTAQLYQSALLQPKCLGITSTRASEPAGAISRGPLPEMVLSFRTRVYCSRRERILEGGAALLSRDQPGLPRDSVSPSRRRHRIAIETEAAIDHPPHKRRRKMLDDV